MQVEVFPSYEDLSEAAATTVLDQVARKPDSVLGLAVGTTPLLTYKKLGEAVTAGRADFSRVRVFSLDEYVALPPEHPWSFQRSLRRVLSLVVTPEQIRVPNGMAADLAIECARYNAAINEAGGIDLMLLGLGVNAHIGFNEPGPCFVPDTHVVELSEGTRQTYSRLFGRPEDMPCWAISMGIRDIMLAERILLLASGPRKAGAVAKTARGDITPYAPASILQVHRNVRVLTDHAASARLEGAR